MPIYEFECEACGKRSEALVEIGTQSIDCRACGSPRTRRLLSAQAPSMHLVKTRTESRKQEARNAQLHGATKQRFKETRSKRRQQQGGGGAGGGGR